MATKEKIITIFKKREARLGRESAMERLSTYLENALLEAGTSRFDAAIQAWEDAISELNISPSDVSIDHDVWVRIETLSSAKKYVEENNIKFHQ